MQKSNYRKRKLEMKKATKTLLFVFLIFVAAFPAATDSLAWSPPKVFETYAAKLWGMQGDIPVQGDYDGDGKDDIAMWRPSTGVWYSLPNASPGTCTGIQWGLPEDTPVSADYDGDGKADIAVWKSRIGVWYILPSGSPGTYTAKQWGLASDVAISPLTGILRSLP
jgi:hypothetical protein